MRPHYYLFLALLVAALLYLKFSGPGFFGVLQEPDKFYDHIVTMNSTVQTGAPITMAVLLKEKTVASGANPSVPGYKEYYKPITECFWPYPGEQPVTIGHYCESYTYLNGRSVRVVIDGKDAYSTMDFPYAQNNEGVQILAPLLQKKFACCLYPCGSSCGTMCYDQWQSGNDPEYEYILESGALGMGSGLDGKYLFNLTIPNTLKAGTHTVEVYYFSETLSHTADTCHVAYRAKMNKPFNTGSNDDYNYHQVFSVTVTEELPPDGDGDPLANVPQIVLIIGGVAIIAYTAWRWV